MLTIDIRLDHCRACGAYGGTQHRPTCQPGRHFKLGHVRSADGKTSAAMRALVRHQDNLVRELL
jgi:hypothetical protein